MRLVGEDVRVDCDEGAPRGNGGGRRVKVVFPILATIYAVARWIVVGVADWSGWWARGSWIGHKRGKSRG